MWPVNQVIIQSVYKEMIISSKTTIEFNRIMLTNHVYGSMVGGERAVIKIKAGICRVHAFVCMTCQKVVG